MGPATLIPFLGIEVDSQQMQLRLPPQKLRKLLRNWWLAGERERVQEEGGAIPGRTPSSSVQGSEAREKISERYFCLLSQFGKRDHMIRLNAAFRADLEWWHAFMEDWNGVAVMSR